MPCYGVNLYCDLKRQNMSVRVRITSDDRHALLFDLYDVFVTMKKCNLECRMYIYVGPRSDYVNVSSDDQTYSYYFIHDEN